MWYICDGCDIYVICCVCSDRKQKNKKTKIFGHFAECLLPWHSAKLPKNALPGLFAECQYPGTRQSCVHYHVFHSFAECQGSGTRPWHSAKNFLKKNIFFFAECWVRKALGKGFFKKNFFAECPVRKALGEGFFKKKGKALPTAFLTRHSAKTPSTADSQFSLSSA